MRLAHLTFGQLHRLGSIANLCRMTRVYHTALYQAWCSTFESSTWSVRHSEGQIPAIARRYQPLLEFLRGPRLKAAIRIAADAQQVPHIPGSDLLIRALPYDPGLTEQNSYHLALLIVSFCEACGVPARVRRIRNTFEVRAETNAFGEAVLRSRTGASLGSIRLFCADGNMDFRGIFWWIPYGTPLSARVNPIRACLNTPDVNEHAAALIFQPEFANAGN